MRDPIDEPTQEERDDDERLEDDQADIEREQVATEAAESEPFDPRCGGPGPYPRLDTTDQEEAIAGRADALIRAEWPDLGQFRVVSVEAHPLDHKTIYDVVIDTEAGSTLSLTVEGA